MWFSWLNLRESCNLRRLFWEVAFLYQFFFLICSWKFGSVRSLSVSSSVYLVSWSVVLVLRLVGVIFRAEWVCWMFIVTKKLWCFHLDVLLDTGFFCCVSSRLSEFVLSWMPTLWRVDRSPEDVWIYSHHLWW